MAMMDDYQKGWALRYLREARAELAAAQKTPYMASGLVLEAVRKAQAAIYYSMGDPVFMEAIVHQTMKNGKPIDDPILRCLVEVEQTVRRVAKEQGPDRERVFEDVDHLIQMASDIVELLTGEKA
jgi:hypothetical protein